MQGRKRVLQGQTEAGIGGEKGRVFIPAKLPRKDKFITCSKSFEGWELLEDTEQQDSYTRSHIAGVSNSFSPAATPASWLPSKGRM